MTPDDALRLATWVEGLFSETTPQQVEYLANQFARFDVAVVEAEVNRQRRSSETLTISNLIARITDEQRKRTPPAARREDRELRAAKAQEDARLASLSDEELARDAEALLAENPTLRSFIVNENPRENPILRGMILNRRAKGGR